MGLLMGYCQLLLGVLGVKAKKQKVQNNADLEHHPFEYWLSKTSDNIDCFGMILTDCDSQLLCLVNIIKLIVEDVEDDYAFFTFGIRFWGG